MALPTVWTKNAVVVSSSGSTTVGTATYRVVTKNVSPARIGLRGVITSSSPARRNVAGSPSTATPPTLRPA